jgi:hypothetical protein
LIYDRSPASWVEVIGGMLYRRQMIARRTFSAPVKRAAVNPLDLAG